MWWQPEASWAHPGPAARDFGEFKVEGVACGDCAEVRLRRSFLSVTVELKMFIARSKPFAVLEQGIYTRVSQKRTTTINMSTSQVLESYAGDEDTQKHSFPCVVKSKEIDITVFK